MSAKDYLEKDYYATLGVTKDADPDLIKKSYRKLARKYHPDQNKDADAENKFKEVSEAYDVLSDPKKKTEYDEIRSYGSGGMRFGTPGGSGFNPGFGTSSQQYDVNIDDLLQGMGGGNGNFDFSGIFGDVLNRGRNAGRARNSRARKGADVSASVTLTFDEALNGATLPLKMSQEGPCPVCLGTGAKPGTYPHECPVCHGVGTVNRNVAGGFGVAEPCTTCHGKGSVVDDPDPACGGTGRAASTRTIQARVPAGVKDGATIRLKGKGQPGDSGGAAGDLLIEVKVKADAVFTRDGDNLKVNLPVRFDEAALGAKVPVPVPGGGTVTVKLAPGTQNGSTIRVRGRGVPRKDGTVGDLLTTIDVIVPSKLDDTGRAAVESLREALAPTDPRAGLIAANKKR
jgi:molecular chaperone DnaJ